jgi:hypothetical protein
VTPLQLSALFAIGGSVLAATVPGFLGSLRASRFAEALDGLQLVAARANGVALTSPLSMAYPESAPLTPSVVPAGKRILDPPGTWSHPTWRVLDFEMERPHFYSFEFESDLGDEMAEFTARALGDLDGDGQFSRFSIVGAIKRGEEPRIYPIQMIREVE